MENKVINQKEYLKKYTSLVDNGDERKKKKKKKKHKMGMKTVKIIDDDIDLKNMRPIEEGEFDILLEGEDAPQIAGIVDERGPVDFTDKRRWKIITNNDEGDLTIINHPVDKGKRNLDETNAKPISNFDLSPPRAKYPKNKRVDVSPNERSKDDSSDLGPPRSKHSKNKHMDSNLRRRHKKDDSDLSPPRQSKSCDSDLSLPRAKHSKNKHMDSNIRRRHKKDMDLDLSPPRQSKNYDSDLSPRRQCRNIDSNLSPPRKSVRNALVRQRISIYKKGNPMRDDRPGSSQNTATFH